MCLQTQLCKGPWKPLLALHGSHTVTQTHQQTPAHFTHCVLSQLLHFTFSQVIQSPLSPSSSLSKFFKVASEMEPGLTGPSVIGKPAAQHHWENGYEPLTKWSPVWELLGQLPWQLGAMVAVKLPFLPAISKGRRLFRYSLSESSNPSWSSWRWSILLRGFSRKFFFFFFCSEFCHTLK